MDERTQNIHYIHQNIDTNRLTDADKIAIGSFIMKEIGQDKISEKARGVGLFFDHLSDDHLISIAQMIREAIDRNRIAVSFALENI